MNDLQQEQLFTDLAPAQAATVEGGRTIVQGEVFDFDFFRSSQPFRVRQGGTIELVTFVESGSGNSVQASVRSVRTGNSTPAEKLRRAKDLGPNDYRNIWTNMIGGTYQIDFRDKRDSRRVGGRLLIRFNE